MKDEELKKAEIWTEVRGECPYCEENQIIIGEYGEIEECVSCCEKFIIGIWS